LVRSKDQEIELFPRIIGGGRILREIEFLCVFICGFGVGAFTLLCLMGLVAANIDEETVSTIKKAIEEEER